MSTNQPRVFNAATDVSAFMQAFTTASVRLGNQAEQPRPLRPLVRRLRTARRSGA